MRLASVARAGVVGIASGRTMGVNMASTADLAESVAPPTRRCAISIGLLVISLWLLVDGAVMQISGVASAFISPGPRLGAFCFAAIVGASGLVWSALPSRWLVLSACASVLVLITHPILGFRSAATSTWLAGGCVVVADDGLLPASTTVLVYSTVPYTPPVYYGHTGLPGRDLREMQHESRNIVVGDAIEISSQAAR